jgi:signal transduction histidine kinase
VSAFRYPAFAAEMAQPRHRAKLEFSVRSGYAIALVFTVLAVIGHAVGLPALTPAIVAVIALKLATNTLQWIALRRDRLVLEAGALNVFADIVAWTGAIYGTGGALSPLVPIYGIELTVVALLTNVGVTVATGVATFACYAAMLALVRFGYLPTPQPLVASPEGISDTYLLLDLVYVAVVLAIPTAFAAAILRALREKEAALLERNEQLVEASRQKSQFMANVTHELRTPIHGISGLSDLVDAGVYGPVTEKQRSAVRDIKSAAQSLLRLIDDLLTLAREDAGKLEYRPDDVDLGELLTSVMATVGFLRGTRDLDVQLEPEEPLPRLHTDRAKLAQILLNLLANAVKFTPDGGRIVLRARAIDGDRVAFAVEDTGIGIPPSELERVFEPFRQVDGSTERRYGGAGLGLALVQRLTSLLGGELRVESEEGRGSTFTVELPIRAP